MNQAVMPPLKLTSDLEDHLRQFPQARRAGHLTTRDYLKAFQLFCNERSPLSGERRHCATIDFDDKSMDGVFTALPRYKRAAMVGDLEAMQEAALDIARMVESVIYQAATAKIRDILIQRRTLDDHSEGPDVEHIRADGRDRLEGVRG